MSHTSNLVVTTLGGGHIYVQDSYGVVIAGNLKNGALLMQVPANTPLITGHLAGPTGAAIPVKILSLGTDPNTNKATAQVDISGAVVSVVEV